MVQEYGIIPKAGIRKGSGGERKPRLTNGLNKALWTPEEDALLIKYVQENGERFWNDIWRSHRLMRCGKSRTDNEIKNYWNIKDSLGLAYLFYPPEIQKEIDLRDIHLQQKEDIENQLQISPSSSSSQNKTNHDSALITPLLSIEAAKNYNDKFIATSSSNSHQARTTISFSSSSSLDENPDFSLIDPMKYPLMYASL
ncbi:transcription factor MYB101 [Tanacetum coccineum]